MKTLKITLATLVLGVLFYSCTDHYVEPISIYNGEWNGTYTSEQDTGIWVVYIDQRSQITGHLHSTVTSVKSELNGTVKRTGEMKVTAGESSHGATFIGEIHEDKVSGTWENPNADLHGVWEGTRLHPEAN